MSQSTDGPFTLSRYRLQTFEVCRRQFQLRFVDPLRWPASPEPATASFAQQLGQQFHLLMERHFRNMPPPTELDGEAAPERQAANERLAALWHQFQQQPPPLPSGRRFVEYSLTVPCGKHFLTGRFDLLIVNGEAAHIFDWKTEPHPRPPAELLQNLQTRLYLALVVAGAEAIQEEGAAISPDKVTITYFYVQQPAASVTLQYSSKMQAENWAALETISRELSAQLAENQLVWALTNELATCARCPYQILCGRQMAGQLPQEEPPEENWREVESQSALAPPPIL